jgi:hypothetical protein
MFHFYLSGITREQFARVVPMLESARQTKPRRVDWYDVFVASG